LQELSSVAQISWEMILGLFTLMLGRFDTFVNHVTMLAKLPYG